MIVKTGDAAATITRVRDVGRVELGAQTYGQIFKLDGQPAAGIAIFQSPGANALDVADDGRREDGGARARIPAGLVLRRSRSTPPRSSTRRSSEVYKTLIEAALLVLIVILIFLQDWRAMLVPATTVPVTIIGAFAAMAALGFSVNLSTLFAIVLAIGIVVDDAIVDRRRRRAQHRARHDRPHDAAITAMDELFGPIIGITLVLMSVFLPAAFLPGLTGQMYAQFALVIAATALISAINAATLKPTQCRDCGCARRCRRRSATSSIAASTRSTSGWSAAMSRLIGRMVAAQRADRSSIALLIVAARWLRPVARWPTGFIPIEDQGYLLAAVQLPDGASLGRTPEGAAMQVAEIARKTPGVDQVVTIAGVSALDNNCLARQCRRRLHRCSRTGASAARAQDLLSLFTRPATSAMQAVDGRARAGAAAAADPGHRQRRRASPCRSSCATAASTSPSCRASTNAMVEAARRQSSIQRVSAHVPRRRAAIPHRGRPREGADAARQRRPGVLDARQTYLGSTYVSPVQQVRPHLPGLCAGATPQFRLTAGGHHAT